MQPPRKDDMRVNHRIRIPEIRVIGAEGEQLGVMDTRDAQALAEENGLDLVEVAPTARPPVCRIMDYGKYKFEQAKKTREAKAKQHRTKVKEVKMKLKISSHDYDFKVRHAKQFLEEGNKVKFRIIFRGRELSRPERGRELADSILEALGDHAVVDSPPMKAGRETVMVVSPRAGLREKAKARKAALAAASEEAEQVEQTAPVAETTAGRPRSIMAAGLDRARQRREAETALAESAEAEAEVEAEVGRPEPDPDASDQNETEQTETAAVPSSAGDVNEKVEEGA
ncbi:MAG: translation initiation factor IF-3 [Gemmatimonadetes bacterium]|nr:translation initiation factor IF-3 [Gemmatimonadota bacterium]